MRQPLGKLAKFAAAWGLLSGCATGCWIRRRIPLECSKKRHGGIPNTTQAEYDARLAPWPMKSPREP